MLAALIAGEDHVATLDAGLSQNQADMAEKSRGNICLDKLLNSNLTIPNAYRLTNFRKWAMSEMLHADTLGLFALKVKGYHHLP